jgi:isorenieratene synthase
MIRVMSASAHKARLLVLGARPSLPPSGPAVEDWRQARPAAIGRALDRALARPSGNWYVLAPSRDIGSKPSLHVIDGVELVAWRAGGVAQVAPNECPHMGASLAEGCVEAGQLICPWHGLRLGPDGHGAWRPLPLHEDGVLTWVRLGPVLPGLSAPVLAPRPAQHLTGVVNMLARCTPADVIANRLDPWHGVHLHNYSFARLRVLEQDDDVLKVRVAFRILGPVCVEVDCTFHSPEPRTIVMTIVDGEGRGSVVETHATPVGPETTRIIEATLATSERPGFRAALLLRGMFRPLIERASRRLWVDDVAYAERMFRLRERANAAAQPERVVALRGTPQK